MSIGNLIIGVGTNIDGLKKGMADAVQVVTKDGKKLGDAAKAASDKTTEGMKGAATSTESLRTQLRKATQDAQKMAAEFGITSKEFRVAAATAGELKDQMGDVSAVINLLSQDSQSLAMLGHSLKIAGSMTQVFTGAMGLLGDQSKQTQEMLLKVQSAMAFGQGIAQLGELKDSWAALTNAIKLNPLAAGLVAAAVVGATAAYIIYNNSITDAERAQAALNEAQAAGMSSAQEELVHMNALVAIAKDVSQSTSTRQRAIDELNKKYPTYLSNLSLENINSREAAKGIDMATAAIQRRAMATALEQKLVELNKKLIERKGDVGKSGSILDQAAGFFSPSGAHGVIVKDINSLTAQIDLLSKELVKYGDVVVDSGTKVSSTNTHEAEAVKVITRKTEAVKKLTTATTEQRKQEESISIGTPTTQQPGQLSLGPAPTLDQWNKESEKKQADIDAMSAKLDAQAAGINASLQAAMSNVIVGWAELTGAALAGATVSFESFGQVALQAITGFMKQMGEQYVAIGISRIGVDSLISVPGAGPGIVAAGTALIVAASMANTMANKSPMNGSSGVGGSGQMGGTNQRSGGQIKLAAGGIAFAPTLATIGDNKGARFNPEVVAPLDRLKSLMGDVGGKDVNVHGQLYGETILLSSRRAGQKMSRRGMRY